jgi:signal transduction histidine kinase
MSHVPNPSNAPEETDITSALLRLAETITGHTRLDTLLPMIVELTSTVLDCRYCLLSLWDDNRACFVAAAAHGLSPKLERLFHRLPIAPGDIPFVDKVVRQRRPVVADADDLLVPAALWQRMGEVKVTAREAVLGAPLLHHDHVMGVMAVINDKRGFGSRQIGLLNGIARQTALAVASVYAFEAERRRRRDLEALQGTITSLSAELEPATLCQRIAERAAVTFAAPAAALFLWDEISAVLPVAATHGLSADYARRQHIPIDLVSDLMQAHPDTCPFALPDLRLSPLGDPDLLKAEGLCAALVIPLFRGDRFLGLIKVYERTTPTGFKDDALALAQALGHQTVIALENARLYQQAQNRSRQLAEVLAAGHEVHVNQDIAAILQRIADGIQRGLGWQFVLITRYDHAAGLAYGVASAGVPPDARERLYQPCSLEHRRSLYEREQYRTSRSYFVPAERGGNLIVRDPAAWATFKSDHTSQQTALETPTSDLDYAVPLPGNVNGSNGGLEPVKGWQSDDFLIVPILDRRGDVLGTISVDAPHHGRRPVLTDVQALEIFANQAAVALENTRLFQVEQRRAAELSGLADITAASSALTDLGETYRRVTQIVAHLLGAEKCVVVRFSNDMLWAWAESPGYGLGTVSHERFQITSEMAAWIKSADGRALVINDINTLPQPLASFGQELGASNALMAFFVWRDRVTGVLVAANKPSGFGQDDATLLTTVAHQATITLENARLFQSEQARRRQLEGLQKTIAALSAELHLDPLLHLIAEQTASIFNTSAAAVLMWDQARETLVVRAHYGLPADFARHLRLPYQRILSELGHSPDADLLTIYDMTAPVQTGAGGATEYPGYVKEELVNILGAAPDLCSALLCALQMGGQLMGALVVFHDCPRQFHPDEKALARTLAQQAAIAIENAQLYNALQAERERLRALSIRLTQAQESERTRIARELHDEAGQSLTAVRLQLDFIASVLPPDTPEPVHEQIDEAQTLVSRTLEEIRRISIDLRPSLLDDLGLMPALRWQCDHFSRHVNLKTHFESKGNVRRLDADVETAVYRAAQEALTNIARHAQATEAKIMLDYQDERLCLVIADNGQGFSETAYKGMGVGLTGMRERIATVGGTLYVDSSPGDGLTLRIEVPLKPREEQK